MLPWLERNVLAVLARLQEGDRRALASKEERATRWDRKLEIVIMIIE